MSTADHAQQPDDMSTIGDAARRLGIPYSTIRSWVQAGKLPSEKRAPDGLHYVSLAAVLALRTDDALTTARADGFVPQYQASRLTGVPGARLTTWIIRGLVASQPGPYGRLVRLADVEEQAADPRPAQRPAVEPPPLDPHAEYVTPAAAARSTGFHHSTIRGWARKGAVRTQPGRYGPLVHLGDVAALAAQRRHGSPAEGKE